jgi:hypothetical protein
MLAVERKESGVQSLYPYAAGRTDTMQAENFLLSVVIYHYKGPVSFL